MREEHMARIIIDGIEMYGVFPDRERATRWVETQMQEAARYGLRLSGVRIDRPRYFSDITGREMGICHGTHSRRERGLNGPSGSGSSGVNSGESVSGGLCATRGRQSRG